MTGSMTLEQCILVMQQTVGLAAAALLLFLMFAFSLSDANKRKRFMVNEGMENKYQKWKHDTKGD